LPLSAAVTRLLSSESLLRCAAACFSRRLWISAVSCTDIFRTDLFSGDTWHDTPPDIEVAVKRRPACRPSSMELRRAEGEGELLFLC
jgi:hypothetical protein